MGFGGRGLPAAAQGLVQGDQGQGQALVAFGQPVPGLEQGGLALQDVEKGGQAGGVQAAGRGQGLVGGGHRRGELLLLHPFAVQGDERVLGLGKGGEQGLFVPGPGLVAPRLADLDSGPDGACVEQRPAHRGAHRPEAARAAEQVAERTRLQAEQGTEREAGEEFGHGRAHGGRGRGQLAFGGANVGPLAEQVRGQGQGQMRGHLRDLADLTGHPAQVGGLLTQQQGQPVRGLGRGGLQGGHLGAAEGEQAVGLVDLEPAGQAKGKLAVHQFTGLLLQADGVAGDGQPVLGGAQFQVGARHLGREGDERVAVLLDARLEGGVRRLHPSLDAAEQVEFPGCVEPGREQVLAAARVAGVVAAPAGGVAAGRVHRG